MIEGSHRRWVWPGNAATNTVTTKSNFKAVTFEFLRLVCLDKSQPWGTFLWSQLLPTSATCPSTSQHRRPEFRSRIRRPQPQLLQPRSMALINMNIFTLIVALVPFLSFALAWPAKLDIPSDKQELAVVYHRANSSISVEALSSGVLVGRDCSAILNTGTFANLPVIFDVDDRGSGNLTVGPSTYWIHEDTEYSGGITCGRMYNDVEVAVSCTVTIPAELTMSPLSGHVMECITNNAHSLSKTLNAATRSLSSTSSRNETEALPIHPRQGPICIDQSSTSRWACGDPHQNFYHRQLSGKTNCGAQPVCAVSFIKPNGVSVSYTAEKDMVRWISGDFHVQKSWKTDPSYTCVGQPGETVCVWYKFAHTAYRVQNSYQNTCGWQEKSDAFILFSPNQDNIGGGQYCVIGPCRYEGDWWWDYSGPTGDALGNHGC